MAEWGLPKSCSSITAIKNWQKVTKVNIFRTELWNYQRLIKMFIQEKWFNLSMNCEHYGSFNLTQFGHKGKVAIFFKRSWCNSRLKSKWMWRLWVIDHICHFEQFLVWVIWNWQHWQQSNILGIIHLVSNYIEQRFSTAVP